MFVYYSYLCYAKFPELLVGGRKREKRGLRSDLKKIFQQSSTILRELNKHNGSSRPITIKIYIQTSNIELEAESSLNPSSPLLGGWKIRQCAQMINHKPDNNRQYLNCPVIQTFPPPPLLFSLFSVKISNSASLTSARPSSSIKCLISIPIFLAANKETLSFLPPLRDIWSSRAPLEGEDVERCSMISKRATTKLINYAWTSKYGWRVVLVHKEIDKIFKLFVFMFKKVKGSSCY